MTDDKSMNIFPEKIYVILSKDKKWCLALGGDLNRIENFLQHKCLPKIYKTRQMALNAIDKSWRLKPEVYGGFEVVGFNVKCEEIVEEEKNEKY